MMQLHSVLLGRDERARLVGRAFDEAELEELYAMLLRGHKRRIRMFWRVVGMTGALVLVLLWMTYTVLGTTDAFIATVAAMLLLCSLCFAVAWVLTIGLFAYQFNRAIDEGYPELQGRLHL